MAKQGMKRPEYTHTHPKNEVPPVPELQGKAKRTKEKAKPIPEPCPRLPKARPHRGRAFKLVTSGSNPPIWLAFFPFFRYDIRERRDAPWQTHRRPAAPGSWGSSGS